MYDGNDMLVDLRNTNFLNAFFILNSAGMIILVMGNLQER